MCFGGDGGGGGAGGPGGLGFAYGGAETGTSFTGGPGSPGAMGGAGGIGMSYGDTPAGQAQAGAWGLPGPGVGGAAVGGAGLGAAQGLGELSGPGGFGEILGKAAPILGGILGFATMGPTGVPFGIGLGKGVSTYSQTQDPGKAVAQGALTGMASAMGIPGLALGLSSIGSQIGQNQPSDLAVPGSMASLSGMQGMQGGMMTPEQAVTSMPNPMAGDTGVPMGGPAPITSLPTGPVSASSLSVPSPKSSQPNISNMLASRGIRGAGRTAPKAEWFEGRRV